MSEPLDPSELSAQLDALMDEGARYLRGLDSAQLARSLAEAWTEIADPERALGREARERLPDRTGLSLPSVAWALHQTLGGWGADTLSMIMERMRRPDAVFAPPRLAVVILAGNVFTACVAPIVYGLLSRAPLALKVSSRDDLLPRLFHRALERTDPELARALLLVRFRGGAEPFERVLFERADLVSVYGSDATIASVRARLAPTALLEPHGHGLGVAWVAAESDPSLAAAQLAVDIAAYDQRGCMSPHAVFVEGDGGAFAEALAEALEERASIAPRGPLSAQAGAVQLQWRGVATARGRLIEGSEWAVSHEGDVPLRISPGFRNIAVLDVSTRDHFLRRISPLGVHLKAVGVATGCLRELASALPPGLAPRVCRTGDMQRPSPFGLADGRPPWAGFTRYRQI